jgi:hypothetical protein
VRRSLGLWVVFFAAYAATLGLHLGAGERYSRDEAHVLMVAQSITSDGDVDLRDEYSDHAWTRWHGAPLKPSASLTNGRLVEPPGVGFALLVSPAYALGGPVLVELFVAALIALGFVAAAALARVVAPEPWATRAAVVGGLSPAVVGASTTIGPELVGGAVLAMAAVLALRVRVWPRVGPTFGAALLVAALPWLALKLVLPAAVVALSLWWWLRRRNRGIAGFTAVEVVLVSGVIYITVNDRLFGGLTPYAANGDAAPLGHASILDRLTRIVGVFVDPWSGVLLWAPFGVLALVSVWLLARSYRERLSLVAYDQVDVESSSLLLTLICGAVLLVAIVASPSLDGPWFAARDCLPALPCGAALCAWGYRHFPRVGNALALVTLAGTVALLIAARL